MKIPLLGLFVAACSFQLQAQSPCLANDTLRIVVIGSSTAAGAGASPNDSAWVNRYRNYLKTINSANEVINLAQGGYNTWRLMPDYFSPPSNRPQPDTLRNISQAIRQNPDAIIINLPSNDAAIGTGVNEQMSNFIHMDSLAKSAGIPVWVCTTQPRNFNAGAIFVQIGVRDSIQRYFGSRSIDFWTGLANPFNTIDTSYDSGDGVHVNNLGHRLLFNRVKQKQLPDSLVVAQAGLDLWPKKLEWLNPSTCGSEHSLVRVQIANLRLDSLVSSVSINMVRENRLNGNLDTISQVLSSIAGCDYAYVDFIVNTATSQNWKLWAYCSSPQDSNTSNNTSSPLYIQTQDLPSLLVKDSTFCTGDSLNLAANSADSIFWFSDSLLQQMVATGTAFNYGLAQNDTLYLQARRGPFVYLDQTQAAAGSNINWNGAMFNLIAGNHAVVLDSIRFFSGSTADIQVNLRTRAGSYLGHENNSGSWSSPLSDSVYNAQIDSSYFLNFGGISINAGDTLGCYLHLENANHRLRYQSSSAMFTYAGTALSVEAGSGIAHTFGTIYHPRHINAEFYYHYGNKPNGQCQSDIETMILNESEAQLSLGGDTLHDPSLDLVLKLPSGFHNAYWWISPQAGDSLVIPANSYSNSDSLWVVVSANDSLGCVHTDSLLVLFSQTFSLNEIGATVSIYPNPAQSQIQLNRATEFNVYDLFGREVYQSLGPKASLSISEWKDGLYILRSSEGESLKFLIKH